MQSALKDVAGISDLELANGAGSSLVKFKGQLIRYTGSALPEQVIQILHEETSFRVKKAAAPKVR